MRKISLIEAPIDFSSYGHNEGTALGPKKLNDMGLMGILKNNHIDATSIENIKFPSPSDPGDKESKYEKEILQVSQEIKNSVGDSLKNERIPVTIGGDHSVSLGSVAGLEDNKDVGVLWIDAHADANTPETTTSGNIHGMVAASIMGFNKREKIRKYFRGNYIDPQRFVYLGLRNVDSPEKEFIEKNKIYNSTIWDIEKDGIHETTERAIKYLSNKARHLHVSLDMDVVDEMWAPGVGITTKGGLTYREIIYLAKRLSRIDFGSLDIVELNPNNDIAEKTSELAIEIICAFFGVNYGPYESFRDKRGPLLK